MIPVLNGVSPRFLVYLLSSPQAQKILLEQTRGVAQRGINLADLRTFPIPLPTIEEQNVLVDRIESILELFSSCKDSVRNSFNRLAALNQSTLAKAFRGELVPQDPDDEPASVLLKRIRAEKQQGKAKARAK